ncbi:ABC transporter permease [Imhoffiella purpurea]|nr:MlaE family lipid ABC transporter permease subunit [Imhoffiella purpurea]
MLDEQLTAFTIAPVWERALALLQAHPKREILIDASRLKRIDDTGIAFLYELRQETRAPGTGVIIRNLSPELSALVPDYPASELGTRPESPPSRPAIEQLGYVTRRKMRQIGNWLDFIADCARTLGPLSRRGNPIRWRETLDIAAEAGANAVPIVLLIGFLMGVIIAFEIALVAREFGAVIFVIDGVGIAMLRELGPLMTAILFAGRSGAAFAAQIGTQKVNEELDAIRTFGLDPIHFLVLPRLLAAALVVPLLTVFADVVGLFGGALVLIRFDIGLYQFYYRLLSVVELEDLFVGLLKAATFGLAIAAIGCRRGLTTGAGATAVGLSATGAVVTSIVCIVVLDGLFTILFDA